MSTPSAIAEQPKDEAWHHRAAGEALAQFGSSASGLSAQDAARRLAADGPNELKEGARISPLRILLWQFKSLIIWIVIVVVALLFGLRLLRGTPPFVVIGAIPLAVLEMVKVVRNARRPIR